MSRSVPEVLQGTATKLPWPDNHFDAVLTDPPYYDNVPYSDLSDFFYVWLKRTIGDLYPELFATPLTPKSEEMVADASKAGGMENAMCRFEEMLTQAFREIHRVLKPDGIAVIVFAHKTTEAWETVINALLEAGLYVPQAHHERSGRVSHCAPGDRGARSGEARPVLGGGHPRGGLLHERHRSGGGGFRQVCPRGKTFGGGGHGG